MAEMLAQMKQFHQQVSQTHQYFLEQQSRNTERLMRFRQQLEAGKATRELIPMPMAGPQTPPPTPPVAPSSRRGRTGTAAGSRETAGAGQDSYRTTGQDRRRTTGCARRQTGAPGQNAAGRPIARSEIRSQTIGDPGLRQDLRGIGPHLRRSRRLPPPGAHAPNRRFCWPTV